MAYNLYEITLKLIALVASLHNSIEQSILGENILKVDYKHNLNLKKAFLQGSIVSAQAKNLLWGISFFSPGNRSKT